LVLLTAAALDAARARTYHAGDFACAIGVSILPVSGGSVSLMASFSDWLAYFKLGRPAPGRVEVRARGTFAFEEGAELIERLRRVFGAPEGLSVLDLGCGPSETVIGRQMLEAPWRRLASVEAFAPYVDQLQRKTARAARHEIHAMRIEQIFDTFARGEFDVAFLIDVLEHFTRRDALRLIVNLNRFVNRGIVVFAPLGLVPQEALDGNALQCHRSIWQAAQFARLGFDVEVFEAFHGHLDPPATAAWAIRRRGIRI
jgi:SAM-dependent methyltransferase